MKNTVLKAALVLLSLFSFTYTRGADTHPYLYVSKEKFISLSGSHDSVVRELRSIVIEEAEKAIPEVGPLGPDVQHNLSTVRAIQGRLLNLSAAYNFTGDTRFSDAAKRQIAVVTAWEDLGTSHFLDVGEAAFALGVSYDWLYDILTPRERQDIEQTLVNKAFAPYFEVTEETGTWLRGDFNWNQVCHGGMVVAALAIKDIRPELCRRIVDRAVECVPYASAVYAPDGAYPEGPSYWEYGTSFQVLMMEALRSVFGHSYGLEKAEGFMKTADFRVQVCGNTGEEYGYSDYHKSFFNEPVMMWFARELGRYDLQEGELDKIRKVHEAGTKLSRQTVFDLLWWSGLDAQSAPPAKSLECWFARGKMPLAVMRTDKAHNDAYLAFKGGTANHSHGHMDSGSFIYESQGVRWALDLGTEVYDTMRAAGLDLWNYRPESTRWTTFRPSSESHNILRINGAPLHSMGVASEMSFAQSPSSGSATLDTTPLYSPSRVSSVKRTVTLGADGNLSVVDEVSPTGEAMLTFQWITDADAVQTDGGILLSKGGKHVLLSCEEAESAHIEDVSSVPGIQNSPNPGAKRILFVRKVKGGSPVRMEVKASAQKYVSQRPAPEKRLFQSDAIEAKIREVTARLTNPKLAWMFANCFPNTLDTTVHFGEDSDGNPRTFVYTGDIHAMWLRDSGAQVWPYVALANEDPHLKEMLSGVINCQFELIGIDPYANAFNDGPTGGGHQKDRTQMSPYLHERKWEIDSVCYPIRLAYHYWKTTGDASVFGRKWLEAIEKILQTLKEQQRKEDRGPYRFERLTVTPKDTKLESGYGAPIRPVGLIASSFRPSDDATTFEFLIPSNFFAVTSLRKAAEILETVNGKPALASECRSLAGEVEAALKEYAVYNHPKYGKIYAYEVDGYGNQLIMDDANVPSLLAMAYLGDVKPTDKIYRNTRKFVWSLDNPYFFKGKVAEGIGGPHIGMNMIWPMSIMMKAFTSDDDKEIKWCIETLLKTDADKGFIHESFYKDDPSGYTRDWFAWQNTLFGELILKLLDDGKLELLNSITVQ